MAIKRKVNIIRFPKTKVKATAKLGSASWLDKRAAWLKRGVTLSHSLEEKKRMRALLKETRNELRRLKGAA